MYGNDFISARDTMIKEGNNCQRKVEKARLWIAKREAVVKSRRAFIKACFKKIEEDQKVFNSYLTKRRLVLTEALSGIDEDELSLHRTQSDMKIKCRRANQQLQRLRHHIAGLPIHLRGKAIPDIDTEYDTEPVDVSKECEIYKKHLNEKLDECGIFDLSLTTKLVNYIDDNKNMLNHLRSKLKSLTDNETTRTKKERHIIDRIDNFEVSIKEKLKNIQYEQNKNISNYSIIQQKIENLHESLNDTTIGVEKAMETADKAMCMVEKPNRRRLKWRSIKKRVKSLKSRMSSSR